MPNAAIIGNTCTCPVQTPGTPPTPHSGGPITQGAPTVLICNMPAGRLGDVVSCAGPPPHTDTITKGSMSVLICNMPAAYMTSTTACGGTVTIGAPTVIIGG